MATAASAVLLVVLVVLAAIDLRLDTAADSALIEQIAGGGEPRRTAGIATALDERRRSDFERRLLVLADGGLLLFGIAFAAAWRFARRVEGPMEELRAAVEQLAGGNWATHIETPAGGYGADLAHALERLRLNLSDHAATGRALDIMLDSMNDAVFVTSPDGLIKRVNVAATQLLGWSQMELLGRELAYVISDQDRTNFNIEQAVNEILELTVRTQNGQTRPAGPSFMPPRAADNILVGHTRQLVEILVGAGHKADAQNICTQALVLVDDPRLQSAVSDAEKKIGK